MGTPLGGSSGTTVGGGIAGFASKSERPGIKIYNDHSKYNEWEFIYDYAKDKTLGGGQTMPTPQNQTGLGTAIANGVGTGTGSSALGSTGGGSQSAFGNTFGSNSGSGNGTSASGSSGTSTNNSNSSTPSTGP